MQISPPEAPCELLVNGVKNPLAVDGDSIRFTWMIPGTQRGETQTAYQIVVASRPELAVVGKADLWDSGKVVSDKSASVPYGGKALPTAARCWWSVRVWNQGDEPGPCSSPATFDTGLPQGSWTARYIWDGTDNQNNFAYFRKSFSLSKKPALAKIFVMAHNDYLLYLNGRVLGMGPGRCDPYKYGQYNAFDVTQQLLEGHNVLAAIGHWHGNWKDSGVNAKPAFLLETRIVYDDETSQTISTDASWKTLASTPFIETDPVYFGSCGGINNRAAIQFDGRREPEGWTDMAFDDSAWGQASEVDRSDFVLFAQKAALQREQAELEPVRIIRDGDAWLVDFGRCIDGWPKLTMRANQPGDAIRVEYFQMPTTRWGSGWDQYTCRGGDETWKPNVGRHASFQVLKITGYAGPLQTADVRAVWAYTDADVAGRFRCSSELLNSIYTLCERSARQNIQQAMISVDANREQSPWTADSWNIGNVLLYNHRNSMILDKVVRDYASEQMPCGDFYACSPAACFRIPEWSMYWPMLLWQQYLFSGDEALLAEMAPRLESFLTWIKTYQDETTKLINPPDKNWDTGIRISDFAGGNMPSGDFNIATACQYYENLRIAARVFAVLGQTDKVREYQRQAEEVKTGINANLFNGEYYLVMPEKQNEMYPLAQAWALRFDIVPPEAKSRLLATVRKAGKPNIGGYGGDALYNGTLHAGGMGDYVVQDLARYQLMLKSNNTNHETFDIADDINRDTGEVNHAWTAYPGYLLQKYFSGIQPTGGGFSTFDVRPEIGGLTFAESTAPTVKGLVTTRWEKIGENKIVLSVTVPGNSRATIYVPKPTGNGAVVLDESGTTCWPADAATRKIAGISSVEDAGSSIKCCVGAGAYRFTTTLSPSGN